MPFKSVAREEAVMTYRQQAGVGLLEGWQGVHLALGGGYVEV